MFGCLCTPNTEEPLCFWHLPPFFSLPPTPVRPEGWLGDSASCKASRPWGVVTVSVGARGTVVAALGLLTFILHQGVLPLGKLRMQFGKGRTLHCSFFLYVAFFTLKYIWPITRVSSGDTTFWYDEFTYCNVIAIAALASTSITSIIHTIISFLWWE